MRYVIISKGLPLSQVEAECLRLGAGNIKTARVSNQVFCDLEEAAVVRLGSIPGLSIKPVGTVSHTQFAPVETEPGEPTYAASQISLSSEMYDLRSFLQPPVTGEGVTIALLDSGIMKEHTGLKGKVVHEVNFTTSPTVEDVYSHGTAVAYVAAGGRHAPGEESGIAPGARLISLKVLGDDGIGTDESVVLGLEELMRLWEEAEARGLPLTDPMYPNVVNMSFGKEDTSEESDPIRLAIKAVSEAMPPHVVLYAAAGNSGPNPGTILLPASLPEVASVGAVTFAPFAIWEHSSRGPTREGRVAPSMVFYGVNVLLASAQSPEHFERKSGTSFSCPAIAGFWALALEGIPRVLPPEAARSFLEAPTAEWIQAFSAILASTFIKPSGAPGEQDNDYGYGMPLGGLFIRQLQPQGLDQVLQLAAPALGLGLVGMMAAGMVKAMRH